MTLIVLCGLPYSGKSRRAEQLRQALAAEGRSVYVVDDASVLGTEDATVYCDSAREKALRGTLRASVERRLSRHDVVILDSLNNIKGFRYELYCLARAAHTPMCLVYCVRPGSRSLGPPVDEVEEHQGRNLSEPMPLAEIQAALFENRAPRPHQSTQSQLLASSSFLHQLDQVTNRVLARLLEAQKSAVPGDLLTLPGTSEHLRFTWPLTMAELSRLRRQFISYTKMHPNSENLPQLANMFLQYLSQSLH
ncbi:KTI12-like protein [Heterocephalus glaber]|uniref:Protein KTI12 homolog n=1 Tax=Heterocephalus glaber TaxID=10181 RepID=G5BF48_HETGA|nr:KTI12-like protein [Heterocephalus glaber]